ncbi:DNA ligase D [Patescibacteria group bacterium]|nr:DNA ligase D [Patescibacteria group bacterium]
MTLKKYKEKRTRTKTPEPSGKVNKGDDEVLRFVVHKHHAQRLHFDLRLELFGVLVSFAVPKEPSKDPKKKRLAIHAEDHPFEYRTFEGEIPEGQYGAGKVEIWDEGVYNYVGCKEKSKKYNEEKIKKGLTKGHFVLEFYGKKLKGTYALVKFKTGKQDTWLFYKVSDERWKKEAVKKKSTQKKFTSPAKKQLQAVLKSVDAKKEKVANVSPMLAELVREPFDSPGWLFEIKYDGFRAIAEKVEGEVDLYSRNGKSFNERFPEVVKELKRLPFDAVFDGELVMVNKKGHSQFDLIKDSSRAGTLTYCIFDLLSLQGKSLIDVSLTERKKVLRKIFPRKSQVLLYVDHIEKTGISFFDIASKAGLEGVMAKKADSAYEIGKRSTNWKKIKRVKEKKVYIVGFTEPKKGSRGIGSLALAQKKKGNYEYVGNAGSGISERQSVVLRNELEKVERKTTALSEIPKTKYSFTWVKPLYKISVQYSEVTGKGMLRHPVIGEIEEIDFESYQQELKPKKTSERFHLSNPNKILYPQVKYTKKDIAEYYIEIGDVILPYLKNRPMVLHRFPEGIDMEGFYQKDMAGTTPKWVKTKRIYSKSTKRYLDYVLCNNLETLVYLVNLGSLELHPWHSQVSSINNPDYVLFDLDPHGALFINVVRVAREIHQLLDEINVPNYCKTSGKTGLHIYVPLEARYTYAQARTFAELVGRMIVKKVPEIATMERTIKKREKKVYIDVLQNRKGQTAVSVYSLRPVRGALVSTPLKWSEVTAKLSPQKYTLKTMGKRIKKQGDLWEEILKEKTNIQKALTSLEKNV